MDAYLLAAVSNYDCDSVFLTSKEGSFEKDVSCHYTFKSKVQGPGTIYIHYISNGDTILTGARLFETLLPPTPRAHVSDKAAGSVHKDFFVKAGKIDGSYFMPVKRWLPCAVESYQIIITRRNAVVFDHYNANDSFDKKALGAFSSLESNDRVNFINIQGCSDKNGGYLNSIGFTIQ
ncbi:hypothetical protein GCM10023184_39990 [Flaviaesturariibacter amylovorans]|uniref:Uncharacterized protein n=2 Tax=Flaviaesturariibacter amylovorans TaxID=1084520 RepID=A0ABP8HMR4_9BACT